LFWKRYIESNKR